MIEPPRTDARVRLGSHPGVAVLQSEAQHLARDVALLVEHAPVRLAHAAGLVAHPAQVAAVAAVVPDDAAGLQFTDHAERLGPLVVGLGVDAARPVGSAIPAVAAVGPVEPHLEDVAVLCQQLAQLVAEVGNVFRAAVVRMIPIPGREIDGKLQPLLAAGIGQLAHHVALALFPRCVLDGILRIGTRPHTKAAVVLGGEDDAPHACLLADASPLAAVEAGGVEQLQVLVAEAPFLVGIGVQRVVDEGIHLHVLPAQLVLAGYWAAWLYFGFRR